ncbi:hypothetical protein K0M31_017590 [Melipona bicolor]|uniref:Uncharacterized protein n=1 Tax=Melipona bicolor TaxID=60889 RepID=A0AA40G5M9_9HYME|nr:hypothetical protein K0M31_017590 [Melipona bicolor]
MPNRKNLYARSPFSRHLEASNIDEYRVKKLVNGSLILAKIQLPPSLHTGCLNIVEHEKEE